MIETRIEVARQRTDVLIKMIWIKDLRQPPEPDQPVDRGWEINPSERKLWGKMYPAGAYRLDLCPSWIVSNIFSKVPVDRNNHLRIPDEHLLDRNSDETAPALSGNIASSQKFDRFYIY